jgi:hypothetical protein
MTKKTKKRIVYALMAFAAVGLVSVVAFQFIMGSVLRQMTHGRLEGADYWSQKPAILSAGLGFGLAEINEESPLKQQSASVMTS